MPVASSGPAKPFAHESKKGCQDSSKSAMFRLGFARRGNFSLEDIQLAKLLM